MCVQVEETEKEREERLKQWENFLEEGEGEEEKEKGKGEKEGTGTSKNQPSGDKKVCATSWCCNVLMFLDL